MKHTYPSFRQLKDFILHHPQTTIRQIQEHYHQQGQDVIAYETPHGEEEQVILAYNIQKDFFVYLQSFVKENDVVCEISQPAYSFSGAVNYHGKGKLLPIVLSMKK